MVFYSPFHLSWNIATELSSQFVSCIESLKKIVKQKTRGKVWAPAVREGVQRSAAREQLSRRLSHHGIANLAHA
jgi:hypothetical protein